MGVHAPVGTDHVIMHYAVSLEVQNAAGGPDDFDGRIQMRDVTHLVLVERVLTVAAERAEETGTR